MKKLRSYTIRPKCRKHIITEQYVPVLYTNGTYVFWDGWHVSNTEYPQIMLSRTLAHEVQTLMIEGYYGNCVNVRICSSTWWQIRDHLDWHPEHGSNTTADWRRVEVKVSESMT